MTVEEFKKKHKFKPKRTSKLENFKEQILKLYEDKASLTVIQLFLNENNCLISIPAICKFIQKNSKNSSLKKEICVSKSEAKKPPTSKITKEEKTKSNENDDFFNIDFSKKVGPDFEIKHVDI